MDYYYWNVTSSHAVSIVREWLHKLQHVISLYESWGVKFLYLLRLAKCACELPSPCYWFTNNHIGVACMQYTV